MLGWCTPFCIIHVSSERVLAPAPMPLRDELESAKAIDQRTGTPPAASASAAAAASAAGDVPAEEVEWRLVFVRRLLTQLSRGLCDDIEVSEDSVRLHRQLQAAWELQMAPVLAAASRYPADTQERLQLVVAEREKISREVDDALEAAAVEEQLTNLQRCTRQLESARASGDPDAALVKALAGRVEKLVAEIKDARTATPAANADIDALIAHAQEAAGKTAKQPLPEAARSGSGVGNNKQAVSVSVSVSMDYHAD